MMQVRKRLFAIKKKLYDGWLVDLPADYHRAILLTGTARSGTTWLSNLINYRNEYRYIFEPFYYRRVPAATPFGARIYVRPGDSNPALHALAADALSGRIRNDWTARYNQRIVSNKRLVKSVRANTFLKWLRDGFPNLPIILLIRHPAAVAQSWLAKGYPVDDLSPLWTNAALAADFLGPHVAALQRVREPFEAVIWLWAVETIVPLTQCAPDDVHLVFYEDAVTQPQPVIRALFAFLGKRFEDRVLANIDEPSQTSRDESAIHTGADPVNGWQQAISAEQQAVMQDILARFGLERLYGEDGQPHRQLALDLLAARG